MGRKKQYLSNAEKQKAYRQKKPSKLNNQEKMNIAKVELSKLKNPSRNDLIYGLCISQNWSRTLATETVNMLELSEKIVFAEKTETKPEKEEWQEWRILGKNPDNKRMWNSLSETDREELRGWYAHANTKEAFDRRFEVYYFLKALNEWLREQNLEVPSNELVSDFEIHMKMQSDPTIYQELHLSDLSKIPHDAKNRIVTDPEEIRTLKDTYREIWKADTENHPNSLI